MSRTHGLTRLRYLLLVIASLAISGLPACAGDVDLAAEEYIEKAKEYHEKDEPRAAIIELKNALLKKPDSTEARWLLGQIYLEQAAVQSAEKEFRRAVEFGLSEEAAEIPLTRSLLHQRKYQQVIDSSFNPERLPEQDRAELLALRANAYLGLREQEKAAKLVNIALALDESNREALTTSANLLIIRKQPDKARKQLETVLQASPEFAPAWNLLGMLDYTAGDLESAVEDFSQAMQDPLYRDGSQMSRALLLVQLDRVDQAEKDIKQLRQRYQQSTGLDYAQGLAHLRRERYKDAKASFEAVLGAMPNHQPALYFAGVTNAILGNTASAEEYLERHLALNPGNVTARKVLAQIELAGGDSAMAEQQARAALQSAPDDFMAMSLLATSLSGQGKMDAAVENMQQMVAMQPESPAARTLLGTTLLRRGDVDEGIGELERSLELDPTQDKAIESLILQHVRQGDTDKALEMAQQNRDSKPDSAKARVLLGMVYFYRKENALAIEAFQDALAVEPGHTPAYRALALIAIREKQLERAEGYYREALSHHPDDIETLTNLANLKGMQGDKAARIAVLEEAVNRDPEALNPRLMVARYYLEEEGNPGKAVATLDGLRSRYPESRNLLGLLAESELAAGQYAEAKFTLTRLALLEPEDPRIHMSLAAAYEGLNDREMMRAELERAAELDPENVQAELGLARLAMRENKLAEAESRITGLKKKVGESYPALVLTEAQLAERKGDTKGAVDIYRQLYGLEKSSTNLRHLSRAQWNAGDREAAVRYLKQGRQDYPTNVRILLELAQRYLTLGQTEDAIATYKDVLEIAPANVLALNNLASVLTERDSAAAKDYAERAYALAPESNGVMDTLAMVLLQTGDATRAARMMERVLAADPGNPGFSYHYAQILEAQGRRDEAIRTLEGILDADSDFADRQAADAMLRRLRAGP